MGEKNQNGKGSKWRKTSFNKYWSGYDEIDWSRRGLANSEFVEKEKRIWNELWEDSEKRGRRQYFE